MTVCIKYLDISSGLQKQWRIPHVWDVLQLRHGGAAGWARWAMAHQKFW